jgi:hypothetical protein
MSENPYRAMVKQLVRDVLTSEYASEAVVVRYVRQHVTTVLHPGDVAFALRRLKREGVVESVTPAGSKDKHWRLK